MYSNKYLALIVPFSSFLLITAVAENAALSLESQSQFVKTHWYTFVSNYRRSYGDENELTKRFNVWKENFDFIQKHNKEAKEGKHSYFLAMNNLGDWTEKERSALLGLNPMMRKLFPVIPENVASVGVSAETLPDSVDWRKEGYVTPVKDQGSCGSCWAFSAVGTLEGAYRKKNGKLVSLSEQNLVDCTRRYGNFGCDGGYPDQALKYVRDFGINNESAYGYTGRDQTCSFKKTPYTFQISAVKNIESGNELALQRAVANVGPISVSINAGLNSFSFYSSGIYNDRRCSSRSLNHAVTAVGYGNQSGVGYWIIKNSWGTRGINGYMLMARNARNMCGVASDACYPEA